MTDPASRIKDAFTNFKPKENQGTIAIALAGACVLAVQAKIAYRMYFASKSKFYTVLLRGRIKDDLQTEHLNDRVNIRYESDIRGGKSHEHFIQNEDGYEFIEKKRQNPKVSA